jgi:hypothetical protein
LPLATQRLSLGRRRDPLRLLRIVLRIVIVAAILAAMWGAFIGVLWLSASSQLRGVPVAALREDVLMLGASGARAPEDATTVLVLLVEPLDATVRRPSPLAAAPVILQVGADRELPGALVLPLSLEVMVDGRGRMTLESVQRELGADRLAQAVIDYTEVRLDHVVVVSTDLLPGLIRLLGPLEVCGGSGCSTPTPDDVRAWQRDPDVLTVLRRSADVLRAVSASLELRTFVLSPLVGRNVVALISGQVVTDVDLGIGRLVELAARFSEPTRIDAATLPLVRNPTTGELVVLEESAMLRFQRLREGMPFDQIDPSEDVARLRTVTGIAVLNGAGIPGLAAFVEAELRSAGFLVIGTGNDSRFDRVETVISYLRDDREAEPVAFLLAEELPGSRIETVDRPLLFEGRAVPIVVSLGSDRVATTGGADAPRR